MNNLKTTVWCVQLNKTWALLWRKWENEIRQKDRRRSGRMRRRERGMKRLRWSILWFLSQTVR